MVPVMGVVAARAQSRNAVDDFSRRVKGLAPELAARLILDVEVVLNKLPPQQRIALYEELSMYVHNVVVRGECGESEAADPVI